MTLGELAQYFNQQRHLGARLTVIRMQDWQRGDWFDSTGVAWIDPSPNLRSLTAAMLYPAISLVETTNISVGRGTDTPFEQIGAPFIDARALAARLNARFLPGVRFVPVSFTPLKPYPYAGERCNGVRVIVTAREELDAPELGIEIAAALYALYPERFALDKIDTLLANAGVLDQLRAGEDAQRIAEEWQPALEAFLEKRKAALLY